MFCINFDDFIEQHKKKAAAKTLTSGDMAMYHIRRAYNAKSNEKIRLAKIFLMSAFTPISSKNELANGAKPYDGVRIALDNVTVQLRRWSLTVIRTSEEEVQLVKVLNEMVKELLGHFSSAEPVYRDPKANTVYAYIFTKQDMSREQQLVQTAHCTMVLGQAVAATEYDAKKLHFTVFGVPDGGALEAKKNFLEARGVQTVHFIEPDMGNVMTSFACMPMKKSQATKDNLFVDNTLLTMV
jgi:hypothetical protein